MAIATRYGQTPWTTDELAALHGVAGPRAKRKQEELDELIVEVLGPAYVEQNVRADQAVASIRARAARLHRLFESGDPRVGDHITYLVKLAYDRVAADRLDRGAKRLASGTAQPAQPKRRRATA